MDTFSSDQNEPAVNPVAQLKIGDMLGRFRVTGKLGRGAMGWVVSAQDTTLHRVVALKLVPHHPDDPVKQKYADQFIHEARAVAALIHPGIVQIYEIGEDKGMVFVAMEMLEGGTLQDRLNDSGTMDWQPVVKAGIEVAEALAHTHEAGVIHRDIKPANIMLNRTGQCKVTDFGLATMENAGIEADEKFAGTPYFMAPQAAEGQAGPASDIFSLAAVMWYLLTGQPAYDIQKHSDVRRIGTHLTLKSLKTQRPDVPDVLVSILEACLMREPTMRYESMTALAQALKKIPPHAGGPRHKPAPAATSHRQKRRERERRKQKAALKLLLPIALIPILLVVGVYLVVTYSNPAQEQTTPLQPLTTQTPQPDPLPQPPAIQPPAAPTRTTTTTTPTPVEPPAVATRQPPVQTPKPIPTPRKPANANAPAATTPDPNTPPAVPLRVIKHAAEIDRRRLDEARTTTMPFKTGSAADMLVVLLCGEGGHVTSVTYAGRKLQAAVEGNRARGIWYLSNPPSSGQIVVNILDKSNGLAIGAIALASDGSDVELLKTTTNAGNQISLQTTAPHAFVALAYGANGSANVAAPPQTQSLFAAKDIGSAHGAAAFANGVNAGSHRYLFKDSRPDGNDIVAAVFVAKSK